MDNNDLQKVRAVKEKVKELVLGKIPEVNGVGISATGVHVSLERPLPQGVVIPAELDGVAIEVEVVGRIVPLTH